MLTRVWYDNPASDIHMAEVQPVTDQRKDGSLPTGGATEGDTLGFGGPHTHPVSAPHEFTPESGTPAFSKGHSRPTQDLAESDSSAEPRARRHGAEAPTRRETALPD